MKKRSFVPDRAAGLEPRALLSGAAEVARGAVSVSGLGLDLALGRVQADFQEFATGGATPAKFKTLRNNLHALIPGVPFAEADGLGPAVGGILRQMEQGLASGTPHAINQAYQEVVAGIRSAVQARVADGSIVIR